MSIAQERASDALEKVLAVKKYKCSTKDDKNDTFQKRYRAYVDRLGPMIISNGLGQALATEQAAAGHNPVKPEEIAHAKLYENISSWLCRQPSGIYPGANDLITALMNGSQSEYIKAQSEALAWLEWHKRFCRAYLPRDTEAE